MLLRFNVRSVLSRSSRPLRLIGVLALLTWVQAVNGKTEVRFFATGEEFAGPFSSWKNVKTDYGAKGDGVTDDAPAIQKAFDDLKNVSGNAWSTLYFPAGTYRINSTISTMRINHQDWLGCQIIGDDPATTIIQWNGPEGKPMIALDAWYCKVGRLSFDGRKKADTGLLRWNNFATYCELSDLWFKDISGNGIRLGSGTNGHEGQAEHAIERCRFTNCGTGILTADWNTMDIYIWYCLFQDCERGIHNNMGGYQAFNNLFLRSKVSDMGSQNNMVFNIVNNTSIGSKCFLDGFYAVAFIQGNKIYDTLDSIAMTGKEAVIGNVIRSREGNTGPCVRITRGNHLFVDNTFTVANPVMDGGPRTVHLNQKIVDAKTIPVPTVLRLPAQPLSYRRTVFEVQPGTGNDAHEIQVKIAAAAAEPAGTKPIVHIPKGKFVVNTTVVIPANRDMQIVGDGGSENGTVIGWNGVGAGPVFQLVGPSRVTMRDLSIALGDDGPDALIADNADQVGGRIYCDQVVCAGNDPSRKCDIAMYVNGVENSDVTYLNAGWGEFTRAGVLVKGGPMLGSGKTTDGQVSLLLGALGNNENRLINVVYGGRVLAYGYRDETPVAGSLIDLNTDSMGAISIAGMSWAGTPSSTVPFIKANGFKGTLAYVANSMGSGYKENDGSLFVQIAGDGTKTRILSAADEYCSLNSTTVPNVWRDTSNPKAQAILLSSYGGGVNLQKFDIPNVVSQVVNAEPDSNAVLYMLSQMRNLRIEAPITRKPGVTDVKLIRVLVRVAKGRMGLVFKR